MPEENKRIFYSDDASANERLDRFLSMAMDVSRAHVQKLITDQLVTIDGKVVKANYRLGASDSITVIEEPPVPLRVEPQVLPLDILYEDSDFIVLNKARGMVVHPAAGNPDGTLVNALLHHCGDLSGINGVLRPGIVHRLDKDTSGLLVIARTLPAHKALIEALSDRDMHREYMAVAQGLLVAGGMVDLPIGRHPRERTRMAVTENGREAITHYRVAEKFRQHTLLRVQLETGRTHQIRVHMSHLKLPLVGDPDYGGRLRLPKGASTELVETLRGFRRQALHAARLELEHPATGELMAWEAPIPEDMQALIELLREDLRLNPDKN